VPTYSNGDVWIFVTVREAPQSWTERLVNTAHIASLGRHAGGAVLHMSNGAEIVVKETYDLIVDMLVDEFNEKRVFVSRSQTESE
jgi:uncharacterized protein YlzI (FlbEa/FlbD family)